MKTILLAFILALLAIGLSTAATDNIVDMTIVTVTDMAGPSINLGSFDFSDYASIDQIGGATIGDDTRSVTNELSEVGTLRATMSGSDQATVLANEDGIEHKTYDSAYNTANLERSARDWVRCGSRLFLRT